MATSNKELSCRLSRTCLHCKGSGLDPREGYLCEACEGSGSSSASQPIPPPQPKRVGFFTALLIALGLAGCSLTPTQRTWAGFAAGVLVVGAIHAHDADRGKPLANQSLNNPNLPCRPQPDGSCR